MSINDVKSKGKPMNSDDTSGAHESKILILDLENDSKVFKFDHSIIEAQSNAYYELEKIEYKVIENQRSLDVLTPDCDMLDYSLAASSGLICSILDIFLVGKPGESPIGTVTDNWFEDRIRDFAKLFNKNGKYDVSSLSGAIKCLEEEFKIPYDQRGAGDAASIVFNLNPTNHHFKSLAHNPTLLGLFFSVLDQFSNTSHFVSGEELISLQDADGKFELSGSNIPSKFFCAFVNWLGHLISDVSGSSGSKGRGMGIPSPIWSWSNDIIAIKNKLNIPSSEFDSAFNQVALKIFEEGYDFRFQVAQTIPVLVNELIVRSFYSIRRCIKYFSSTVTTERSFREMWNVCEPFKNASVKRMLTIAHGAFCLIDAGDAIIRGFAAEGGYFNVAEFAMRVNIIGIGRFVVSLYGESTRGIERLDKKADLSFLIGERTIVQYYIEGLRKLAEMYDDNELLEFSRDFVESDSYKIAFEKTVKLAELRKVSEKDILRTKKDIDSYFSGGISNG